MSFKSFSTDTKTDYTKNSDCWWTSPSNCASVSQYDSRIANDSREH